MPSPPRHQTEHAKSVILIKFTLVLVAHDVVQDLDRFSPTALVG